MLFLIFVFLTCGIIGWFVDTGYRTIKKRKITIGSYFRFPFCSIYGAGGVLLYVILDNKNLLFPNNIFVALSSLIVLEYTGSFVAEKFLKTRLWDYSSSKINVHGRIDLEHSLCWLTLSLLFYSLAYPWFNHLESRFFVNFYYDEVILVIFLFLYLFFVYLNQRERNIFPK
jgi:uncharacterized membrane protein